MIDLGKLNQQGKNVILERQENDCIKCISHCTDKDGYVRIRYKNKHDRLFRVLYQQKYGDIPKGLVLRHLCNNAWCVNIEHLKAGTQKENVQDMIDCGRSAKGKTNFLLCGEKNPISKLKEENVKEIYLNKGNTKWYAEKYNISRNLIWQIRNKKVWKHYTDSLD